MRCFKYLYISWLCEIVYCFVHDPFVWWKQWLHCPSPSKPRLCSVINVCEAFRHWKYINTFEYTGFFFYEVNIEHRFIEDEPYTNSDCLYYLLNTQRIFICKTTSWTILPLLQLYTKSTRPSIVYTSYGLYCEQYTYHIY